MKTINLVLAAVMLIAGCSAPSGGTSPSSFDVLPINHVVPDYADGFYKPKGSSVRIGRAKAYTWYEPGKLNIERTYVNGRLHSARSYRPDGALASTVSVGTGVVVRYHGDGSMWVKQYFERGRFLKREEYRHGKLYTTKEMNFGNPIPNDGWNAFTENVFTEENGNFLLGLFVLVGLGIGLGSLDLGGSGSDTPPPGYWRNSQGQIVPIHPLGPLN